MASSREHYELVRTMTIAGDRKQQHIQKRRFGELISDSKPCNSKLAKKEKSAMDKKPISSPEATTDMVERKYLGGSCVNFGCTPTKAAIASAHAAHMARRGGEFGILIPKVDVNFRAVIERAQKIALTSRTYLDHSFETTENPRLLRDP